MPIRPKPETDETVPTTVFRKPEEPGPDLESTRPTPVAAPAAAVEPVSVVKQARGPRRWPWIVLGLFLVVLLAGLGAWIGYGAAVQARRAQMEEQKVSIATEHFMLGLVAQQNKQYEIAVQQFEYVIQLEPSFPGAQDKLREVMIASAVLHTPTPKPTVAVPTLTPTPDTRPQEEIIAQARQQYANKEWDALFGTIDSIRQIDPQFHAVEIDGMMYVAFRNRGIDKIIHQANLEGGLYDLAMAERFAPLDVDSNGYRNWARLYLNGASFWEVDWPKVMAYFEQIYPHFPNMRDSSGMTAIERYRIAALSEGDKLFASNDFCGAYDYYQKSLQAIADPAIEAKSLKSYEGCYPPTPTITISPTIDPTLLTPAPGITVTPETPQVPPTETIPTEVTPSPDPNVTTSPAPANPSGSISTPSPR